MLNENYEVGQTFYRRSTGNHATVTKVEPANRGTLVVLKYTANDQEVVYHSEEIPDFWNRLYFN